MKKRRTQQWLQEIYKHPKRYEGKVVIILNDTQIVGVAEDFTEAKYKREELAASSPSIHDGKMTLFLVPRGGQAGTDSHAPVPKPQRRFVETCISCEFANELRFENKDG